MPSVSNGGGSHGRCCRCRQCRGLDQLAVGGIDENGVLYHYFKESKASQIESSRTYDPFWSLYIFRLRRSNKSHAFTFSLRGEKGLLRVFYYHLLRRKPPDHTTSRDCWHRAPCASPANLSRTSHLLHGFHRGFLLPPVKKKTHCKIAMGLQ